jgi:hypothetical protein
MANSRVERILILAKTYPSPSAQYVETSCVAGINEQGNMRRLYPVPFRLIEEGKKFKKWQWIEARLEKANKDHRPESHRVYIDTVECGNVINTKWQWAERRRWLDKLPVFGDMDSLEAARLNDRVSLALVRPGRFLGLDITEARNANWTPEERDKLTRQQMQGELFSEVEARQQVNELRKVPFDFHYRYTCATPGGQREHRHKVVDWEAGALFWNCRRNHGATWETPFRAKLESELVGKDLMFLMGNQHRFQDQWLIISLIYPPKSVPETSKQQTLF